MKRQSRPGWRFGFPSWTTLHFDENLCLLYVILTILSTLSFNLIDNIGKLTVEKLESVANPGYNEVIFKQYMDCVLAIINVAHYSAVVYCQAGWRDR